MLEIKMVRSDLESLIKKMALPTENKKTDKAEKSESSKEEEAYDFPFIAPLIHPNGTLEWIALIRNLTVWVRGKNITVSGITEPMRLPLRVNRLLNALKFFKSDEIVSLVHDVDNGVEILTTADNASRKGTTSIPSVLMSEVVGMEEKFPGKIGTDGIVVLKGDRKLDLHAVCDVSIFKDLIANTQTITGNKNKDIIPKYNIIFDGANGCIRTIAGSKKERANMTFTDEFYTPTVVGNGETHYARGFKDVINVLDGEIHVYAFTEGPLWVAYRNEMLSVRYLIPPVKTGKE